MPERSKAVNRIVEITLTDGGHAPVRNMLGEVASVHMKDGEYVSGEDFLDRFIDPVERIWELVVDRIDFNVVILTAQGRHLALDHEDEDDSLGFAVRGICGECLREALMLGNTMAPEWKEQPKVPRGGYGSVR